MEEPLPGPPPVSPGTLYLVSTPIGNLEDISSRALAVLGGVDLIAAEDTRTTGFLLKHFGIRRPMVSYFSRNEQRRIPGLIGKLQSGAAVAVVSDAGTPAVSDPAARLISAAIDAGIPTVPVPGATAILPALIVSGISPRSFVFEGFLPVKKGRSTRLAGLASEPRTIILYESPHRLLRTLDDLKEHLGDRRVSVARELTKKFEEVVRGRLTAVAAHFREKQIRGEFVLVIEGKPRTSRKARPRKV